MSLTTQPNSATTVSATAVRNPFDQLITLFASGSLRDPTENERAKIAFQNCLWDMHKGFAALAGEITILKGRVKDLESINKQQFEDQKSLQKQIDTMKEAKLIEKFNASLEILRKDAKKLPPFQRSQGWLSNNSGIQARIVDLINSLGNPPINQTYRTLVNDIAAHPKNPPIGIKQFTIWKTANAALIQRIILLPPGLIPT